MIFRIREARERCGLTQAELASKLNINAVTLSGYETGKHDPKSETLSLIAVICNTTTDFLLGRSEQSFYDALSSEALGFARQYDKLDLEGKSFVGTAIKYAYDRLRTVRPTESTGNASRKSTIQMRVYDNPAAAGAPLYAESDYELLEYSVDDIPTGADYGVRICGKSMEPEIPDGCTAWVRKTERICDGDIVIAWVDGDGTVCKRAVCDGNRIKRLKSINRAYDDITGQSLENLRIYGKVLGYTME